MLRINEEEIEGRNIKSVMPTVIQANHDKFIQQFIETGDTYVLQRQRLLFIKDYNGFIKPVNFKLDFFFSQSQKYSFIA